MNQITQAFLATGVKLPKQPSQSERLWRVIKDNPGITAARARDLSKLNLSGTSSLLSQMVDRGMMIVEKRPKRVPGLRGFVERNVFHYSVHPRMNGEYEMLPAPVKHKPALKVVKLPQLESSHPDTFVAPKPTAVTKPEPPPAPLGTDIDHLTLGQARALYGVLHQMFGGRV